MEQRPKKSLFPGKCSHFQKQQGQIFCRGVFMTLRWRVIFLATISVFPLKFILVPLTCYWIDPNCPAFSTIHHPHPLHTSVLVQPMTEVGYTISSDIGRGQLSISLGRFASLSLKKDLTVQLVRIQTLFLHEDGRSVLCFTFWYTNRMCVFHQKEFLLIG